MNFDPFLDKGMLMLELSDVDRIKEASVRLPLERAQVFSLAAAQRTLTIDSSCAMSMP